jgi:hypothetical protein
LAVAAAVHIHQLLPLGDQEVAQGMAHTTRAQVEQADKAMLEAILQPVHRAVAVDRGVLHQMQQHIMALMVDRERHLQLAVLL